MNDADAREGGRRNGGGIVSRLPSTSAADRIMYPSCILYAGLNLLHLDIFASF